jgi:hypothetical protein
MGIQSRQILRAHDYMWVLNIVGAQHNSWLPIQLVDAQNLPERVSPPACLGVRNLWAAVDEYGHAWTCEDAKISHGYMGADGLSCTQYIWACRSCVMVAQCCTNLWAPMQCVWTPAQGRFMDAHVVWRWVRKMGTPTMRRPCPCHVNTPIFAPPRPRNFSRAGFASCAKFFKNFPQKHLEISALQPHICSVRNRHRQVFESTTQVL